MLGELLKNSRRSDRQLAKALNVSQPTITRNRHKLEREGIIQAYTIIPDFKKVGFEILALTFVKMRPEILTPEIMEKARRYAAEQHNGIFASTGEGLGVTGVMISFHESYTDYHKQLNQFRVDWKELIADIKPFIISIGEGQSKSFSLTYLADALPQLRS